MRSRNIVQRKQHPSKSNTHASKTLLLDEKGYLEIEKEALGIIFMVKSSIDAFREEALCLKRTTDHYCLFLFQKRDSYICCKLTSEMGEQHCLLIILRNRNKSLLCNTIRKLPVTIEEIRNKAKIDKYIIEKKEQIIDQLYNKNNSKKIFSICNGILMYSELLVIPEELKKEH